MSIPNETWWLMRISAGTHPEEVAFHKAALDDPEDPSTYAAWGDWCEEHGYLDTAAWLRSEGDACAREFYHDAHCRREQAKKQAATLKLGEQLKAALREMDERPGLDLHDQLGNRRIVMWKALEAEVEKGPGAAR